MALGWDPSDVLLLVRLGRGVGRNSPEAEVPLASPGLTPEGAGPGHLAKM